VLCSLEVLAGFALQGRLQGPKKHLSPAWGQRVGGVSGRPTRETRWSDPPTCPRRNGERHPDSQEAGRLRGLPAEGESWSVRPSYAVGLFPRVRAHRRQRVSSGYPEEGNVVSVRQAHALDAVDAKKRALRRSRTRPSLGPETRARQSSLNSRSPKEPRGGAVESVSRSGKPAQAGGTGTGVEANGRTCTAHRVSPPFARRGCA